VGPPEPQFSHICTGITGRLGASYRNTKSSHYWGWFQLLEAIAHQHMVAKSGFQLSYHDDEDGRFSNWTVFCGVK
jgi:hypothetical protein